MTELYLASLPALIGFEPIPLPPIPIYPNKAEAGQESNVTVSQNIPYEGT